MRIQLLNLVNSQTSLNKIIEQDLPAVTAFRLGKLAKAVKEELASIEETRVKLIQKYGEKEDGTWKVNKNNEVDFHKEMTALFNEEVELNCDPIKVSDLGENFLLSAVDVANLDVLISE